jgi:Glyoxalase-like domain
MSIELDHVFICCSADAATGLTAFGLTEGAGNVHPGQGTSCRRFFFHNAYLELLWVSDPSEAQSETTRPTCLWERWTGRDEGACPFGLGFRPGPGDDHKAPFATWEYHPPTCLNRLAFRSE